MHHRIVRAGVLLTVTTAIAILGALFGRAAGLAVPEILPASSRTSGVR